MPAEPSLEKLIADLRGTSGIKISTQMFSWDISSEMALATVVISKVEAVIAPLRARTKLAQTEAYWLVDVWGRLEALKAHIFEMGVLLDSGQPTGLSSVTFRARSAVLILGCHELLSLVLGHLLEDGMLALKDQVVRVKAALPAAQDAITAHMSDN